MRRADDPRPGGYDEQFDALAVIAHRVAYRILGSAPDAEEIAQEALARAYVRWSKVSGYAEPWVARVAANLALGRWRSGRRRTDLVAAAPRDERGDAGADAAAALRLDLVELLTALPRRQREVVVLRFLADRSERETADALGCSIGTVKQHSHRALASLRTSLTDDGGPDPAAPTNGACDVRTP